MTCKDCGGSGYTEPTTREKCSCCQGLGEHTGNESCCTDWRAFASSCMNCGKLPIARPTPEQKLEPWVCGDGPPERALAEDVGLLRPQGRGVPPALPPAQQR